MLTVEYAGEEVAICFDETGFDVLTRALERLRRKRVADHDHLTTPSWGGHELTEQRQGQDTSLIHHLRLIWRPQGEAPTP
jgi:Immunity protein 32